MRAEEDHAEGDSLGKPLDAALQLEQRVQEAVAHHASGTVDHVDDVAALGPHPHELGTAAAAAGRAGGAGARRSRGKPRRRLHDGLRRLDDGLRRWRRCVRRRDAELRRLDLGRRDRRRRHRLGRADVLRCSGRRRGLFRSLGHATVAGLAGTRAASAVAGTGAVAGADPRARPRADAGARGASAGLLARDGADAASAACEAHPHRQQHDE
ncbi:MAG: hypothetical protein ACK559_06605, partial [bacterium]